MAHRTSGHLAGARPLAAADRARVDAIAGAIGAVPAATPA
jgi:hypothetical protein